MTKREKYFKDDITPNQAYDLLFEFVGYISLLNVDSQEERIKIYDKVMEFLNHEVKPTLTEDEQVILRNIDKNYTEICRNESGYLCLLEVRETGTKFDDTFACYNHLFQFIKPRRRI